MLLDMKSSMVFVQQARPRYEGHLRHWGSHAIARMEFRL